MLGHEAAEEQRLVRQAQEMTGEASWLFDQLDIPVGARARAFVAEHGLHNVELIIV
ncbi:hypothetical protein [Cystobacter fuscus]|uniref:hypothetical protein n=1 Tax=Cystobacter fuscus TaxID=43 RepID=UPI001E2B358C|nr:hypothetical protein [Cystobacter fuscus]